MSKESITGISVTGVGEVTGVPDTLIIGLGVSLRRDTVGEATTASADAANALIDSLTSNGVSRNSIATTAYSINPEYDYRNDTQRLLGYRVNNTVEVAVRDLERSGDIIDAATVAAGDAVTVNGISFRIEDDIELMQAAREAAWKDAVAKASQLADLAGRELGPAVSISETVGAVPPGPFPRAALAMAERATPIEPGTAELSVTLQVHFSFAD